MVLFNKIDQLRILKYNLYSSNLLCTNVSISTSPRGCERTNIVHDYCVICLMLHENSYYHAHTNVNLQPGSV